MKKYSPIFLILILLVSLIACTSSPTSKVAKDTNIFTSKTHGDISIFPIYKYLGMSDFSDEKAYRKIYVWENAPENKYIIISQLIVKNGKFPVDITWISPYGALYTGYMQAAYTSIGERPFMALDKYGITLPDCFITAVKAHVNDTEAIFRILIVPDKMCSEVYEPIMQELDRVAIINPLG